MKVKTFLVKKILSLLKRHRSLEKKNLYSSRRDWTIITVFFFVLIVTTISVHYVAYVLVERGVLFNESAEQEEFKAALKRDVIDDVLTKFESRQINTESFNKTQPVLIDPS